MSDLEALRLFEGALEVPASERASWLSARTADDSVLRARVERLLRRESDGACLPDVEGFPEFAELFDEEPALRPGTRLGDFELVSLIAEGGMGRVYEARQGHPSRRVAVKVLRGDLASESVQRRFHWEAELLGRQHLYEW